MLNQPVPFACRRIANKRANKLPQMSTTNHRRTEHDGREYGVCAVCVISDEPVRSRFAFEKIIFPKKAFARSALTFRKLFPALSRSAVFQSIDFNVSNSGTRCGVACSKVRGMNCVSESALPNWFISDFLTKPGCCCCFYRSDRKLPVGTLDSAATVWDKNTK